MNDVNKHMHVLGKVVVIIPPLKIVTLQLPACISSKFCLIKLLYSTCTIMPMASVYLSCLWHACFNWYELPVSFLYPVCVITNTAVCHPCPQFDVKPDRAVIMDGVLLILLLTLLQLFTEGKPLAIVL